MRKFAINNLRSIEKMDLINLKPLTICVGRNSSGKSTFLRTFPLLKQSVEVKRSEPLLWYGPYIDFGSFKECLCRFNDNQEIRLVFEWETNEDTQSNRSRYLRMYRRFIIEKGTEIKVELSIREKYISRVDIVLGDQKIQIDADTEGIVKSIYINNEEMYKYQKRQKALVLWRGNVSLIPILVENEEDYNSMHIGTSFFSEEWVKVLKKKAYKTTKGDTIAQLLRRIALGNKEQILKQLQTISGPELLKKELEKLDVKDPLFIYLNNLIVGNFIIDILDYVNVLLIREIEAIKYIKPIRAMIDRYYRVQGVAIDELDSSGSNLPMLFYNLSNNEKENFRKWTHEKFGVSFSVKNNDGHVSLFLEEPETGETYNLADVGYGYSQVIPIIMQLWLITQNKQQKYRDEKLTLIIEQPELHLHPSFQAKLVEVFVAILEEAQKNSMDLKIIFETHSETMINRIGYLIAKKNISEKMINVLIFDKIDGKTQIQEKKFNEKGILEKWPLGFFSPGK